MRANRLWRLAPAMMVAAGILWGCDDAGDANRGAEQTTYEAESESARLNAFFEERFQRDLSRNPRFQSFLGIKTDYDKWNDLSDQHAIENNDLARQDLETLHSSFDFDKLDPADRLSYRLFEYEAEQKLADFEFRFHSYPINQMRGAQSQIPAFLINIHRISSVDDAKAYIARLHGVELLFDQLIEGLRTRAGKGMHPPKFVFAHAFNDITNILKGAPFDGSNQDSTLLADFRKKVARLDLPEEARAQLVNDAQAALKSSFGPAYRKLESYLVELEGSVSENRGAWSLPDGERYYARRLKRMTSTDLPADGIHQFGLSEVARIHGEMQAIMDKVGFEGTLREFFEFMRTDSRFYLPQGAEGRAAYLEQAEQVIETMKGQLDRAFTVKPKADLIVKAVEPFREKSAGKAFYQQPAPDGSRPGTYYANLYDMADMPIYALESLAYHEGIPGHHMQRAIQVELEGLPRFRKFGGHTAYAEGWGLYSEYLGKEMGFYQDPYSDFGRLAAELWRACRLVVDTGIHAQRWTREAAIDYLKANTPNAEGDIVKAIERYFVMPGQAAAYKIGMRKILDLRARARERLGADFDIREYHDIVLKNGPMPLNVLEDVVDRWIESKTL
ncbi:MAG: DUF885 family protein [Sphingomonadales bacterium]